MPVNSTEFIHTSTPCTYKHWGRHVTISIQNVAGNRFSVNAISAAVIERNVNIS